MSRRDFFMKAGILGIGAAGLGVGGGCLFASDTEGSARHLQGTDLGSLYPFLCDLRDESKFEMSFLNDRFSDVNAWKKAARDRLWQLIPEKVEKTDLAPKVVERVDKGDYIRETVYFNSTPHTRVPAFVLVPKNVKSPVPGLVCFHDHGAMFYWGKEKVVEVEDEHPTLTAFKKQYYGGRSYASDFCRAGFAVIVIDAFYWGERRLITDAEIKAGINDRSKVESDETIWRICHQRNEDEQLIARALYQIGHTWQGIWLRDEIRSLDYLLSRPEVDPNRIGCVGLSVGGFRSGQFAGMEPRVKCAVVDGFMTTYGDMFSFRPRNTIFAEFITGVYSLMDLPDQVSMCCPGGLMVIHGEKDTLFPPNGVKKAYDKIQAVYDKAGVPDNVSLRTYDSPHEFNVQMQKDALSWLKKWLT